VLVLTLFTGTVSLVNAQDAIIQEDASKRIYLGAGFGFDYGGLGMKVEYEPIKHVGLFAGAGYNMKGLGWNLGGSYRILPDAKICPVVSALYGYNAVLLIEDADQYDATSYGVTFGGGVEWSFGQQGSKLSLNLLFPIRSDSFMDKYNAAKNSRYIEMKQDLLPVAFSIGFSFPFF
jgi:hypothetical protein